jgi:Kdo2-lipid IVA lauroyltransferase/acyltransferase
MRVADRAPWQRWITRHVARPLEAVFVRACFRLLQTLSIDTSSAVGGAIARTIGPWIGVSRRARKNLRMVFPEKSDAEIEVLVREMWDNLGRTAAEYPHLQTMLATYADGRIELRGMEHVERGLARGTSIIFFSGHFGNWEMPTVASRHKGVPLNLVYRPANNEAVEKIFQEGRGGIAESLLPKGPEGARALLQCLRAHRHLGMLLDQKMSDGIEVPFFGRPAMTAGALASLAQKFDCSVIPVQIERRKGAHFRLTFHPALDIPDSGDRKADAIAVMTRVNQYFEAWIRQNPGQWLWLHRRWQD